MREIKFNAVDEDTGEYVRYDRWRNKNYNEDNTDNEHLSSFLEFYFGYKLLQYTGLKDKNGKEIYENDIVSCQNKIGQVKYEKSMFIVDFTRAKGHLFSISDECVIVGNVYENPGGLNKKLRITS